MYIFQSSLNNDALEKIKQLGSSLQINVLKTFADDNRNSFNMVVNRPKYQGKVILDSGTYTLNNNIKDKKWLTVDNYATFLKNNGGKFDFYFNFDEAHSSSGTMKNFSNQRMLEMAGLKPIPVIHNLDEEVEYYCENAAQYPLVAIGSIKTGTKTSKEIKDAVKTLYKHKVATHLFAVGSFNELYDAPVYSCDSTSYLHWSKRRILCFFDFKSKKELRMALDFKNRAGKKNDYYCLLHEHIDNYYDWLENVLLISDIMELNDDLKRTVANSVYYYLLEKIVTKIHNSKGYDFSFLTF